MGIARGRVGGALSPSPYNPRMSAHPKTAAPGASATPSKPAVDPETVTISG